METKNHLGTYDYVAVGIYYIVIITVSLVSAYRAKRNSLSGYFLAGRFMHWLPVGASLFASNIGSEHFIGLAGSGAAAGIAVGAFELNALILLQVLGWIFLPVFIASGVCTLPEYMKKRFGGQRIRVYLAAVSLLLYIFTKISVNIYSGSLFIQQALGWNIWYSIVLLLSLTYICSAIGGLSAVIYMETLQFFIIISGSIMVTITGFMEVGGWNKLTTLYLQAVPNETYPNTTCGIPRKDSWIMLRDPFDSDMPWPAFLLGQTPASIWYWCADQLMVQRTLAAKSLSHAQGGTLLAGYVKILPVFIMVLPGMISRVLYPNEIACVKPEICEAICNNQVSCSNSAYPRLVLGIMPEGLRGVMLAVMLAALMSDLSSVFNSASTLFTMDLWKSVRNRAATKELLVVSRVFTAILVVISIVWIPIIQKTQGGQLYIYIQSIGAYLAPPIAAIYCLAISWNRMNEQGAFWGLMSGLLIGVSRMILDFSYPEPRCYEEETRPSIIYKIHYMYFAVLLFWTTIILSAVVSLLTDPLPTYRLIRTTYFTRFATQKREDEKNDIIFPGEQELIDLSNKHEKDIEIPEYKNKKSSVVELVLKRFCGVHKESKQDEEHAVVKSSENPQSTMQNLEQSTMEKWILNSFLVIIICVAISLYAFFSINPLPDDEIEQLRMSAFYQVISNVTNSSSYNK